MRCSDFVVIALSRVLDPHHRSGGVGAVASELFWGNDEVLSLRLLHDIELFALLSEN